MEVLDDGPRDAADRAQRDVGITAHVQDRPGGGEVHRGVGVIGGGAVAIGPDDQSPGVDVHREGLAAEATELQDAEAFLVNRAAGKDRSIDGQADLLVGLAGRAHDRGQAIRHPGDRDGGGGGQAQAAGQVRDDADVVQRRGTDGIGGVGQRQLAQTGGNGRAAADAALGVEGHAGHGLVKAVEFPDRAAPDGHGGRVGDLVGDQVTQRGTGEGAGVGAARITAGDGQVSGDGAARAGLVVQQEVDAIREGGPDVGVRVGQTDIGSPHESARSEHRTGGARDVGVDREGVGPVVEEEFRGGGGDASAHGGGTDGTGRVVGTGKEAARGERQRIGPGGEVHGGRRAVEGQRVDRLAPRRDGLGAVEADVAGTGGERQRRDKLRKGQRTEPDGRIIGGETEVGSSGQGIARTAGQRPGAQDAVGLAREAGSGGGEERVGADRTGPRDEGEGGVSGAGEGAAEADRRLTESGIAGIGTKDGRPAGQGEVAEGHRTSRAAAADELERTAVELDGHVGTDAVAHGLDAGIVPT